LWLAHASAFFKTSNWRTWGTHIFQLSKQLSHPVVVEPQVVMQLGGTGNLVEENC
jgi:hypothetical protein